MAKAAGIEIVTAGELKERYHQGSDEEEDSQEEGDEQDGEEEVGRKIVYMCILLTDTVMCN